MRGMRPFCLVVVLCLLSACAGGRVTAPTASPTAEVVRRAVVLDLTTCPQDARAYLPGRCRPAAAHAGAGGRGPASLPDLVVPALGAHLAALDAATVAWGFRELQPAKVWGQDLKPRSQGWFDTLRANANLSTYPNLARPAVAVATTSQRVLPTSEPAFADPARPGGGYPFDELQNSLIWAGTPLLATHRSADGAWLLVETAATYGWVPARDVAMVDQEFVDIFTSGSYLAVVRDRVAVRDSEGRFLCQARVGMLLPAGEKPGEVTVAVADADGDAVAVAGTVAPEAVAAFPLAPTLGNLAAILDEIVGQTYGWGGLYENRDCSSALQDAFAPFGLPLPRNSLQQAWVGRFAPLEFMAPEDKEHFILAEAHPFRTLLWKPGHIMLYLGQCEGRVAVFHSVWGLRSLVPTVGQPNSQAAGSDGQEGRVIIGQAAITTLEPETDPPGLVPEANSLLSTLRGMTLLSQPLVYR